MPAHKLDWYLAIDDTVAEVTAQRQGAARRTVTQTASGDRRVIERTNNREASG